MGHAWRRGTAVDGSESSFELQALGSALDHLSGVFLLTLAGTTKRTLRPDYKTRRGPYFISSVDSRWGGGSQEGPDYRGESVDQGALPPS